jgi:hypothetical protein
MSGRLYELNLGVVAGRGGEPAVAREQRRAKRLGKSNVNSVVGRQIVAQFPYARQKEIVWIPKDRKVGEVGERLAATFRLEFASCRVPANDLRDFDIDQMGRVQGLSRVEQPPFDCRGRRRAKQRFEHGRSIDDDH